MQQANPNSDERKHGSHMDSIGKFPFNNQAAVKTHFLNCVINFNLNNLCKLSLVQIKLPPQFNRNLALTQWNPKSSN